MNETYKDYGTEVEAFKEELELFLGCTVELSSQTADRPEYPFLMFSFLSQSPVGGVITWLPKNVNDVEVKMSQQLEERFSITAVSDNDYQAEQIAEKAKQFFVFNGLQVAKKHNMVFVDTAPITARNVFIVNETEYRYGFDLRTRIVREYLLENPAILSADIQYKEKE